jgi:hypothetical protein
MMRFKKTIIILLTVCLVASLAAITVNAALSSYGSHVYSSSSITGNITGIVGGSVANGYIAGTGYTTSIVGVIDNNTTRIFSVSVDNTTGNGTSVYGTKPPFE